ncbi:hypothetical protein, partial [Sphingobium sp.]|uniref:hypothetical protein n=1 Tax=Sphingobium sp. TaxID=1912891 RepID=UPI0028BD9B69
MTLEIAKTLQGNGAAHSLAALVLFNASRDYGRDIGEAEENIEVFAFNGPCSLSVHYLIGLGLELMLKSAYVACGGDGDDKHLTRAIGHDLTVALQMAERQGFQSPSDHLPELVAYMNEPYKGHFLRYKRPDRMNLPADMEQVAAVFEALRNETARLRTHRSKPEYDGGSEG